MTRPQLYILRGIPGAGKSTVAETLLRAGVVDTVCEADDYHVGDDGVYRFKPENIGRAHAWCQGRASDALARGENVVVANTNTTRDEVDVYLKIAQRALAEVTVLHVEGDHGSIHGVPPHVLRKMAARWQPLNPALGRSLKEAA